MGLDWRTEFVKRFQGDIEKFNDLISRLESGALSIGEAENEPGRKGDTRERSLADAKAALESLTTLVDRFKFGF
jgi:hypothetical protein